MTLNGRIVDMGYDLGSELNHFCSKAEAKSCILKGNICQLLLTSCKEKSPRVIVLELSSQAELLNKSDITFENNEGYKRAEMRMNRYGKLL